MIMHEQFGKVPSSSLFVGLVPLIPWQQTGAGLGTSLTISSFPVLSRQGVCQGVVGPRLVFNLQYPSLKLHAEAFQLSIQEFGCEQRTQGRWSV